MTLVVERTPSAESIRARPAGFLHDLRSIAGRALRAVPRDLAVVMPPVFISLFFFIVNVATLKKVVDHIPGLNYTAFQNSDTNPNDVGPNGTFGQITNTGAASDARQRIIQPGACLGF